MSIVFGDYTPPKKKVKIKELTIGVFFDGTNNNKNNTNAKEYYDGKSKQVKNILLIKTIMIRVNTTNYEYKTTGDFKFNKW